MDKALGFDRATFNQGKNAKYNFIITENEQPTLTARGPGGFTDINTKAYRITVGRVAQCEGVNNMFCEERKDIMDKPIYCAIDGYNGAISAEASALGVNCGMSTGRNGVLACYCLSAYDSNAMKSPNPHSGCYEAETSRTLDNNGGNPACNQGGLIIVNKTNCND